MKEEKKNRSWHGLIFFMIFFGLGLTTLQQPGFWEWLVNSSLQTIEDKTGWQILTTRVTIEPLQGVFRLESPSIHGSDGELILSANAFEGDFSLINSL